MGSPSRYVLHVLWLARPPYLRWFAAGAIVVAALGWDLSGRRTEPYPFAAQSIVRGSPMSEAAVEWRDVPLGMFVVPALSGTSASVDIVSGDPITESVVSDTEPLPDGWWSVPIDLPVGTPPGTSVRVVLPDGTGVSGIVTQAAVSDAFGSVESGVVGFPETVAEIVAQLAAIGDLVVLVEP